MEETKHERKIRNIERFQSIIRQSKHALAPMVEQCDLAFRLLVRRYGCDLCWTQMYHSRVMFEDSHYVERNFQTSEADSPLIVQLCGNDPEYLLKAAKVFEDKCVAIDLNLGCPQGIAKKGKYGSFLLPDYDRIEAIAKRLGSDELSVPFTVKIRLLPKMEDTLRLCQMLEREGAQLITIHGRTREQNKDRIGACDWSAIAELRSHLQIPVFANGGVGSRVDVERCLAVTGAAGVMVGEALLENPAFFTAGRRPQTGEAITVEAICEEYLDLEAAFPAQPSEIKAHFFKLLYRALCIFTDHRTRLATMNFNRPESRTELRQLIHELAEGMKERGEDWVLSDSTTRQDAWYNRHTTKLKSEKKERERKP